MINPIKLTFTQLSLVSLLLAPSITDGQDAMVYEGFTQPHYDIMVAAIEIGRIEEVVVNEGQRVERGEMIARLEDSLQRASVRIATLQAEMKGEIDAAKAEVLLHEARTRQIRELAKEDMARPDELLRAEADLQIAQAKHKAALEQDQLRKLELERYRLQLERRKVLCPMSGVIAKVFHHPGEYITPGDPAVVRLLVTDQLFAVFNIPVEDINQMQVGDAVRVFLRSHGKTISADIHSLSPSIDGESGTLEVRVVLPNDRNQLRAGDRCTMTLGPAKLSNARLGLSRPQIAKQSVMSPTTAASAATSASTTRNHRR